MCFTSIYLIIYLYLSIYSYVVSISMCFTYIYLITYLYLSIYSYVVSISMCFIFIYLIIYLYLSIYSYVVSISIYFTYRVFQKSVPESSSSGATRYSESIQRLPQKRSYQSIIYRIHKKKSLGFNFITNINICKYLLKNIF